ncbi:MAG: hypothetical protein MMC33_005014 [Icmadophila ericetorum]|nr:hypothetical protein [Icmadophila ericetorum]
MAQTIRTTSAADAEPVLSSTVDADSRVKKDLSVNGASSMRLRIEASVKQQQSHIISALEKLEDGNKFLTDLIHVR